MEVTGVLVGTGGGVCGWCWWCWVCYLEVSGVLVCVDVVLMVTVGLEKGRVLVGVTDGVGRGDDGGECGCC